MVLFCMGCIAPVCIDGTQNHVWSKAKYHKAYIGTESDYYYQECEKCKLTIYCSPSDDDPVREYQGRFSSPK